MVKGWITRQAALCKRKRLWKKERSEPPIHAFLLSTLVPLFVTLKDNRSYTQVFLVHWGSLSPADYLCSRSCGHKVNNGWWCNVRVSANSKVATTEAGLKSHQGVALNILVTFSQWKKRGFYYFIMIGCVKKINYCIHFVLNFTFIKSKRSINILINMLPLLLSRFNVYHVSHLILEC